MKKIILRLTECRKLHFKRYSRLSKNLSRLYKKTQGKLLHNKMHYYMNRGMVSASLVIEFHRQEIELLKRIHQSQIKALDSLWSIYIIDGVIFKESIK
jgi:hypothetical protein